MNMLGHKHHRVVGAPVGRRLIGLNRKIILIRLLNRTVVRLQALRVDIGVVLVPTTCITGSGRQPEIRQCMSHIGFSP